MAKLIFDIQTFPSQTAYNPESKPLNSSVFIAIAAEGKEEVLYLEEIEKIVKSYNCDLSIIILNKYIYDANQATSLSHPKHRYELLEEWQSYYKKKWGISANDEEWLICDRDNQNFKSNQYDKYVKLANTTPNFHFIVSNPAFQLWLLLHYTAEIPTSEIEKFGKCKQRINYIEEILKTKYIGKYVHGSIDWDKYKPHVRKAINNSQQYAEYTIENLKDKTGTHFFKLLEYIEKKVGKDIF